jgi:hypothetical protein
VGLLIRLLAKPFRKADVRPERAVKTDDIT